MVFKQEPIKDTDKKSIKDSMVFKQKPIKDFILIICFFYIVGIVFSLVCSIVMLCEGRTDIYAPFIIFGVLSLFMTFFSLNTIQWFHIYKDHIEVRTIWGKLNEVYFYNVEKIVQTNLPTTKYARAECYLFVDGRPTNKKLDISTYKNYSNIAVRVYITEELREFVERLDIPIVIIY